MSLHIQPVLEDDRFLIRPLQADDLEGLHAAASDPLIWEQHPDKRNEREVFGLFFIESLRSGGALVVIDKASNEIIGTSRYALFPEHPMVVEIGWTFLSRNYWGGAANGAVKRLMIDHALKTVDHVILMIDKENKRSQMAAEKIGAKRIPEREMHAWPWTRDTNLIFVVSR